MQTILEVVSPYDQRVVARLEGDDDARMMNKLGCAAAAQRAWRAVPLQQRIAAIGRCLEAFTRDQEAIATEISRQMGKPLGQARGEIGGMLDRASQCLAIAEQALAPIDLPEKPGFVRRIEHHPLGVVLAIAAWNYPLLIPINVLVPGLLAGNAILLKHSPRTPLTGRRFSQAFADLGVPDLVQDLVISHEQAGRLMLDPRIAHVAFTGSVRGGREVYRHVAAHRFIDVGLELGGKDAAYIAADADLAYAAAGVVDGACYNAGQSCCAVERIYVHDSCYGDVIERARALVADYVLGDPADQKTTMGPMAMSSALAFLTGQVEDAVARGARLLAGGSSNGPFFAPTLLVDVPQDAGVMRDESFGPIVAIARVQGDDHALELMNDSHYGLTASVWTLDQDRAERFARELEVGTVYQNRCDFLDPLLPWTGTRDSGKGSSLSQLGFLHLTRPKSIHFRTVTR